MAKLNTARLIKGIMQLESYKPPFEKSTGIKYLYDTLFLSVANNTPVRISDLDYTRFSLSDVSDFEGFYDDHISNHNQTAYVLAAKLQKLSPITSKTRFI